MPKLPKSRRSIALAAATLALAGTTALVGAGTASAASGGGCRAYTPLGQYPENIQLQPCGFDEGGELMAYGSVDSPFTDIHVYLQVGWKPWYQAGEPTNFTNVMDAGVMGPGTNMSTGYWYVPTNAGNCYYTRMWYVDGSTTYGWTEGPATCY